MRRNSGHPTKTQIRRLLVTGVVVVTAGLAGIGLSVATKPLSRAGAIGSEVVACAGAIALGRGLGLKYRYGYRLRDLT